MLLKIILTIDYNEIFKKEKWGNETKKHTLLLKFGLSMKFGNKMQN